MNLRPPALIVYPKFKNGKYIEEYFFDFWNKLTFRTKEKFLYLDIFWNNIYHLNAGYADPLVQEYLEKYIGEKCEEARLGGRIPFTICQWDDGIQVKKPDNLIVFSMGQSKDVPLPLVSEDTSLTLENTPRLPFEQKDIFCSFLGKNSHPVRKQMADALASRPDCVIHLDHHPMFIEVSCRSKFGLAPRGYGASSFRFFELMKLGIVPVYIHDGDDAQPYRDILDYDKFSFTIHISEINTLHDKLKSVTKEQYESMLAEMERVRLWFTMEGTCEYILFKMLQYNSRECQKG